jgi:hypothetical protein
MPTRKRKDTHNPRWATRSKDKIRVIEHSAERLVDTSTKSSPPRVGRTLTNLRNGSFKLFSIFRSGKSRHPNSTAFRRLNSHHTGPVTSSAVATTAIDGSGSNTPDSTKTDQAPQAISTAPLLSPVVLDIPINLPELDLHNRGSSLMQLTNAAVFDGESEPIMSTKEAPPVGLFASRSAPGLSRQVTAKISNAFFHPNDTVIHRPKQSSRPSILTAYFDENPEDQPGKTFPETPMSDVPSLPSQLASAIGSSNAPLSQSTAPTSLVSSGAPVSAETTHRGQNGFAQAPAHGSPTYDTTAERMTSRWLVFPRQDAPRLSDPSVTTIENAAAAKVFFESHFNELLGMKVSPRSVRRRNIERKLFAIALPNEQRQRQRKEWCAAESHHLRQMRVMKSKTLVRQTIKGVHISNYDIVRVLGKGSFGVVRLVREKSDHNSNTFRSDTRCINNIDGISIRGIEQPSPPNSKTKQVFAMKVIRKSDMLRNSQEGHLRAERDFLVASENCRWVVPLMAAFQDSNNLYLVMEYMVGGDFLGLLLREDILDENVAK